MTQMPKTIAVMSGKGGVGKTSIALMVARILAEKHRTILLDFDICGPSTVSALGVTGSLVKTENGFQPVHATDNLSILSFGLILDKDDVVIWRGPKKLQILAMFFSSVKDYECVVIDTPPGISEEHEFLVDKGIRALIVTTPQNIALNDAQRCVEFCISKNIDIVGIIENMSGYNCECCGQILYPFGSKGGQLLAEEYGTRCLCVLRIDQKLAHVIDNGEFLGRYQECGSADTIRSILDESGFY